MSFGQLQTNRTFSSCDQVSLKLFEAKRDKTGIVWDTSGEEFETVQGTFKEDQNS